MFNRNLHDNYHTKLYSQFQPQLPYKSNCPVFFKMPYFLFSLTQILHEQTHTKSQCPVFLNHYFLTTFIISTRTPIRILFLTTNALFFLIFIKYLFYIFLDFLKSLFLLFDKQHFLIHSQLSFKFILILNI